MTRRIISAALLWLLPQAAAHAAMTVYTSPSSLMQKWYNAGVEKTVGEKLSLGTNAEFFQNAAFMVVDANLNLRRYVASNDGGLYLQGTVMELIERNRKNGRNAFTTDLQAGLGYKWVDDGGLTADVRLMTSVRSLKPYIAVEVGHTW